MPYPLFIYAGLLPWTFFATAVTTTSNSIVSNANLITKVYFPRLIIPTASVLAALVDFAISFLVLIGIIFYYGLSLSISILAFPLLVFLVTLLALAVGIWTAALNVKYRDIRFVVPFLIQLWFFISPIIYPLSLVTQRTGDPEKWKLIMSLNPMTGIVEGFRVALFGRHEFNWLALSISAGVTIALLILGVIYFRRMEKGFADVI
jgi:lipopolysaccharide transport system permease protein